MTEQRRGDLLFALNLKLIVIYFFSGFLSLFLINIIRIFLMFVPNSSSAAEMGLIGQMQIFAYIVDFVMIILFILFFLILKKLIKSIGKQRAVIDKFKKCEFSFKECTIKRKRTKQTSSEHAQLYVSVIDSDNKELEFQVYPDMYSDVVEGENVIITYLDGLQYLVEVKKMS